MKRRSFCLTHEDVWKLQNVQEMQEHDNVSEALRFCIDFAYTSLCLGQSDHRSDDLLPIVKRNNLMLRFLFIELAKLHGGDIQPLSETGRKYLEQLKRQLTDYMENHDER